VGHCPERPSRTLGGVHQSENLISLTAFSRRPDNSNLKCARMFVGSPCSAPPYARELIACNIMSLIVSYLCLVRPCRPCGRSARCVPSQRCISDPIFFFATDIFAIASGFGSRRSSTIHARCESHFPRLTRDRSLPPRNLRRAASSTPAAHSVPPPPLTPPPSSSVNSSARQGPGSRARQRHLDDFTRGAAQGPDPPHIQDARGRVWNGE
jgi:hypothetical protein